ncbi:permease-like cell division protein FtsX [Dactylosporangium sp. NPDC049525]|uniref:permease-like cell division protein FtsX n=1 Tax=Dactylosporangium sp. NPDC049525 TaxID=3154730 RepID=UPI003435B742
MFRNFATVVVLVLFAVPVSACSGDDPDPLPVSVSAYLKGDAEPAAVEARIRAVPTVTSVAFVSRQEAYEQFTKTFKDDPDLIASTKPEVMPQYFTVVVTEGSVGEAVQLVIGTLDGVEQTSLASGAGDVDRLEQAGVLVRLTAGVTDEQRAAVENLVRRLPRTEPARYETGEQTKARLLQRCKGKGDLAASLERVPAGDIPASFRFRVGLHGGKIPQLSDLQHLAGVAAMLIVPVEVV